MDKNVEEVSDFVHIIGAGKSVFRVLEKRGSKLIAIALCSKQLCKKEYGMEQISDQLVTLKEAQDALHSENFYETWNEEIQERFFMLKKLLYETLPALTPPPRKNFPPSNKGRNSKPNHAYAGT